MVRIITTISLFILLCSGSFGIRLLAQSTGSFRIEGAVCDGAGIAVPDAEIEFLRRGHTFTTVHTKRSGRYSTNLPFGEYRMAVRGGGRNSAIDYRRPDFMVDRPERVFIDVILRVARQTCDVGVTLRVPGPISPEPTPEDVKNACGGNDRFIPSETEAPFEMSIDYPERSLKDSRYVYGSDRASSLGQVSVAYNLFSLEANRVVYDVNTRTIEASGNVVTSDGSGKKQHFDSITLKMENGRAVPLR